MGLIKTAYSGIGTIGHWLGENGRHVSVFLATDRAACCVRCPLNKKRAISVLFTRAFASLIKAELRRKNRHALITKHDRKLGVCKACRCVNALKVWTPLDIIIDHLKPEIEAKLDRRCWILKEKKK